MTQRHYLTDSFVTRFEATIVESLDHEGRHAVILDATYFYPTGGGQPNDTGTINGIPVLDVLTRPHDLAVVHVLKSALPTGPAHAEVNWRRRFDHMQQHTGQHILTQAFVTTVNAATVGFHLSPDTVTIDLDNAVDISQIQQAERLANEVVFSGLAVIAREIPRGELEGVRIRRIPEHVTGDTLRVISVGDFDHTACGGTHVANSGQIGLIKVIRADRKAGKTRIEFRCGTRALEDYSQRLDITQALTSQLSTGLAELAESVTRLQDDLKAQQRQRNTLAGELLHYKVAELLSSAETRGDTRIVTFADDSYSVAEMRQLAKQLTEQPGVVALLGIPGDRSNVLVMASAGCAVDARAVLDAALGVLGGRGGGSSAMAQGGGVPADIDSLRRALSAAVDSITS
ncbi:MAG: hypothetical protein IT298_11020 [Chloroflexi bacterium]|nr:hypothetical protein [Chloroflexota bacterium]